jgi:radical SAM protein with 4Fe4S-binding SPASM domain
MTQQSIIKFTRKPSDKPEDYIDFVRAAPAVTNRPVNTTPVELSSVAPCGAPKDDVNGTGKRGKFTLELTTSALCDLACTYCFEGEKVNKQRLEDLDLLSKRIYELLESEWFKTHYDGLSLSFWGGEPTLNPNYIIKIMDEFQHRDDVAFHMYSNGFNQKNMLRIVNVVDTSKFEIQLSYDGNVINDAYRLTKNGKSTAANVLSTFEMLADRGLRVTFKSTLPGGAIGSLYEAWTEFEQMHYKYKERYGNAVKISFSPTIDYSMLPNEETKQEQVAIFKQQVMKIAKREVTFFKENGRHLCSWFAGGDTKSNCSAGLNMASIDVNGDSYACHGALYTPGKSEMKSSNISEDSFVGKMAAFADRFEKSVYTVSDVCKECVATTCIICPVATSEVSKKEGFFLRWTDRQANGLCDFYQTFGEIDRTIQHFLHRKEL